MATPVTQGAPSAGPRVDPAVAGPQTAARLRAVVLGPRGGGTTRRRASDAFRLGFAAAGVAVSIPVIRANSAIELSIVHALNPPPTAIRWLVTAAFWGGSVGVIAALTVVGLLVPRLAAARRIAVAALATWGLCALLAATLGSAAGRPATGALAGVDVSYPVTQLAVTIAVAATALPYLSRSFTVWCRFLLAWRRSLPSLTAQPFRSMPRRAFFSAGGSPQACTWPPGRRWACRRRPRCRPGWPTSMS